jgi:glycosyltransferase 2 family protein
MAVDVGEKLEESVQIPEEPHGPTGEASPDGEMPNGDSPGTLGSKILKPQTIVSFLIALAIMVFFYKRLDISPGEIWGNLKAANPWYFLGALVIYYAGMVLRGIRWRWMLIAADIERIDGVKIPGNVQLTEILILSWFVNCLVPARMGDVYRSYVLKRESKISFSASLGTIVAERVVDLFVLVAMMVTAGLVTFHGNTPGQATRTYFIAGLLIGFGAVALFLLWFARHFIERRLPAKWQSQFVRLHNSLFACLRRPGRFIALSVVIWTMDGIRLLLVAKSLGVTLSYANSLFVSLMSSMLTTLPITPAGLGVVETAMIVVLKWVHISPSLAISIAVMDRLITYWSLIVVGLVLYIRRFRNEVK